MALIKQYLYVGILVAIIGSDIIAFRKGMTAQQTKDIAAQVKERDRQDKAIAALEALKQQREVIYRDRIKIVQSATDECLDKPLPDGLLPDYR